MSKIKQKTSYFLLISFIFLLSCGGLQEAGKVLRNEKTNSTDEFLVKKRDPLILPPDYDVIPEPNSKQTETNLENENKIKKILEKAKDEKSSDTSSTSTENSILRNRDHLFTFLTALIKRNGGELILTEQEIMDVQKNDMVSMKYDQENKKIIFEVESLELSSGYATPDPKTRQDN